MLLKTVSRYHRVCVFRKDMFSGTTLLIVAGARPRRQAAGRQLGQPGQPHEPRLLPHHGQRRLGARLLPEIPEPPRRLPEGMVERGQLGGSQQALPRERKVERESTKRNSNRC